MFMFTILWNRTTCKKYISHKNTKRSNETNETVLGIYEYFFLKYNTLLSKTALCFLLANTTRGLGERAFKIKTLKINQTENIDLYAGCKNLRNKLVYWPVMRLIISVSKIHNFECNKNVYAYFLISHCTRYLPHRVTVIDVKLIYKWFVTNHYTSFCTANHLTHVFL